MDVGKVEPRVTAVPSSTPPPVILSDNDRRTLEKEYSDLLLEHIYAVPRSPERHAVRKKINDLAAQLGKSKEKVRSDINHFERTKIQVRSIRANHGPDSRYGPDSGYFG